MNSKSSSRLKELFNRQSSLLHAGADSEPILFIILASGFILIILLIISIAVLLHDNPYGPSLKISGLEKVSGLPRDEKDRLEASLYSIVEKNLAAISPETPTPTSGADLVPTSLSITSGSINSDSPSTASTNDRNYRSARFLVKIDSIKMAFVATVEWTSSRNKSALSGYPIALTCPIVVSENLYPETPCSDFISDNLGSPLPLLRYLPYRSNDFLLTPIDTSAPKPKILATLLIHSFSTPSEKIDEKTIELKSAVEEYIKSVGASSEDYELSYKVEYGD